MKKLLILALFALVYPFTSCEKDPGLDPLPTIVPGQYMRLDITKHSLSISDLNNTSFGGILTNPGNNVVKYDLLVRYETAGGVISNNYVILKSITSFPTDLKITAVELATALGKNVSDFNLSDKFLFLAYSYDKDGNVANYNSLSAAIKSQPSMKQAYKFSTKLQTSGDVDVNKYDNYEF